MFGKHSESAPSSFVPNTRANTHSVKQNSVYNYIGVLIESNSPLVNSFQLHKPQNQISNNESRAYLFKYHTKPANELFLDLGYTHTERHLRVDHLYSLPTSKKGSSGYAAAHYTEYYSHHNGDIITVHVYITDDSNYVQIKASSPALSTLGQDMPPYLVNSIRNNARESLDFYAHLNYERAKFWLDKNQKVDALEQELSTLSANLQTKQSILNYIKRAEKLVELIDEMNQFNEFLIDSRVRIIQDRIRYLESLAIEPTHIEAVVAKPTEELHLKEDLKTISVEKESRASQATKYQKNIFEQLSALSIQLDEAHNKKEMADFIRIATGIRLLLAEAYFFKKISNEEQKLVTTLSAKISVISTPHNFAFTQFITGNVKGFITVFSILTSSQQLALIMKIFDEMIKDESDLTQVAKSQREICEHLHKNSSIYRARIVLENYSFRVYPGNKWSASIIVWLCTRKKLATFELFLRHGLNPNNVGFLSEDITFSGLRFIIGFPNTYQYVKALLDHGASIDISDTIFNADSLKEYQKSRNNILDKKNNSSKEFDEVLHEVFLTKNLLQNCSDLMMACAYGNYDLIPLLIEQSCSAHIAIGLVYLTNQDDMVSRFMSNAVTTGQVFKTKLEADSALVYAKPGSFHYMFYAFNNTKTEMPMRLKMIGQMLSVLKKRLNKKEAEIKQLIKSLEQIDKDYNKEGVEHVYIACTYAICEKDAFDKVWAEKLMECLCKAGSRLLKNNSRSTSQIYFIRACKVGMEYDLQSTDIYKFAQKKSTDSKTSPGLFPNSPSSGSSSSNPLATTEFKL